MHLRMYEQFANQPHEDGSKHTLIKGRETKTKQNMENDYLRVIFFKACMTKAEAVGFRVWHKSRNAPILNLNLCKMFNVLYNTNLDTVSK